MKLWSNGFADTVYPAIDSDAVKVLYKDNPASRPATPASFVIGVF